MTARAAPKRLVGIDLGTTHTLVAWADATSAPGATPAIFPIPQLVTETDAEALPLLPSCLWAPAPDESVSDPFGDAPWVVGEAARRRGAEVPGRLVASAKSWLSYAGVDRTAAILPWGAAEDVPHISPLEASARYLAHVKRTWDEAFPDAPLAEQEVVLTVPASFDEAARELTVEAAERAGIPVRLLEEPQAAFYDYMHHAGIKGLDALLARHDGTALVLVCDVGGGTTDLSLIKVTRGAGATSAPEVTRIAVGNHLLLGGDNMDLALALVAEERLGGGLDSARFAQLVAAARVAKERLLGGEDEAPIRLLARGSQLVGGTRSTTLTREDAEVVVLDGFFPRTPRDARPERRRSGLVAFGLPYEKDVAITRHLAWFFARHAPDDARPHALLLNGGVFRAPRVVDRITEAIGAWSNDATGVEVLPHTDPDLGVARGAVAYALARRGLGLRIEGGAARGYYVGLEAETKADGSVRRTAVCVVPRGAKEGAPQIASGRAFGLVVGRPVRFDLFASDDARLDEPGDVVVVDEEGFLALPPVAATFEHAPTSTKAARRDPAGARIKVQLEGELTPLGTLDLACVEIEPKDGSIPRRFRLAFQLRAPAASDREAGAEVAVLASTPPTRPPPSLGTRNLAAATQAIDAAFGKTEGASPRAVKDLVRELERLLGERPTWSTEVARALFDTLWPMHRARRKTADHERVFWLLAGFCLRPGFGDPLDATRVAGIAPLFSERLAFPEMRSWQQFWIACRRVAGGLDETTQIQIRDLVDPFLAPSEQGLKKSKKLKPEAEGDMLDMASSLERLPPPRRVELGAWILERTWTDRDPRLWAALGRLGARVPAYAGVHHVVSPITAERWLDHLLREKWDQVHTAAPAAVALARRTGDRARDVGERVRATVAERLRSIGARDAQVRAVEEIVMVEAAERAAFFGEGLPVGLILVD
jgi:molecular chaperone DnaK (HSP70)